VVVGTPAQRALWRRSPRQKGLTMRILVVGRTGQVAHALARLTLDGSISCTCLGRPDLDITDTGSIASALEATSPDIVFNAAAYTAVDQAESDKEQAHAVNATGASLLARQTAEYGIPILHLSTDYVFSGDKKGPYLENDEVGPTGIYGQSKLKGEQLLRAGNPNHVILRTSWVFDRAGSNFPRTMLRLAATRDEIPVVSDQFGSPTDAEEIAKAMLIAGQSVLDNQKAWGTYHFTGPQSFSWADYARLVMQISGRFGGPTASIRNIATSDYPTAAKRPANSVLDCGKFQETIDYIPVPLETSLERCMPYWLANRT